MKIYISQIEKKEKHSLCLKNISRNPKFKNITFPVKLILLLFLFFIFNIPLSQV